MHMSTTRKRELMRHVNKLSKLNTDDCSIVGDENNNIGSENVKRMMDAAKTVMDVDEEQRKQQLLDQLCKNYKLREKFDVELPITDKKQRILNHISTYPFYIIQGSTGCGKTTQVWHGVYTFISVRQ